MTGSDESTRPLEAETALHQCLEGVPFLGIEKATFHKADDLNPVLEIQLLLPGTAQRVSAVVLRNGQPRVVRQAADQIIRLRASAGDVYNVIVAPYITPRAAQICIDEEIGFVDFSGNCRLCFQQVFVERSGRSNPSIKRRDLRSLYSPKASRILRVLLLEPRRAWRVQSLAQQAGVSLGLVSNVKKLLVDREWIETTPDGVRLAQPGPLLEEWAQRYSVRQNHTRDCYSLRNIAEIEASLAELCRRRGYSCALTGHSGAARLVSAVRYQRVMVYVGGEPRSLYSPLQLKEVASGANVSLLLPYDDGVFHGSQTFEDVPVVSPVQLYLDLRSLRGRGEEAAQRLLEEIITPSW
jgi:DNA-binding IclR family transcriptional regulator